VDDRQESLVGKEDKISVLKIAVTGCAGSGKSVVCRRFSHLGAVVVNADTIARQVVTAGSSAYRAIVKTFGEKVVHRDGRLNREMLRNIIVHDASARESINRITHPEIIKELQARIRSAEKSGASMIVAEVPLLYELKLENRFDMVVVVSVKPELQIQRLMKRDGVQRDDAEALLGTQMSNGDKAQRADVVLINNGNVESLQKAVDGLYGRLRLKLELESQKPLTRLKSWYN